MSFTPGTRFGAFEIVGLLGSGGMGEVYRARDPRLGREVAIKVLPPAVAQDPERLARFDREAQVLAALDHPGIATIFGVEQHEAVHGLVMEAIEGPTLAELSGVPMDQALEIARQIADAVGAAHERGIVHRDLKPANIKLRPDGSIKVLDFGLAKALETPAAAAGTSTSLEHSPTITSPAFTQAGMLLGTAAYMSPEQARGATLDRRADVWAFGCVLYELLANRRAFDGGTISDTLAGVLRAEPEWTALPQDTPASIVRLLRRCLAKDRKQRLADLNDARLEIVEALSDGARPAAAVPAARPAHRALMAVAAIVIAGLAALGGWFAGRRGETTSRPDEPVAFSVSSDTIRVYRSTAGGLALSDDGRRLVFVGEDRTARRRLFWRTLATDEVVEMPETDSASAPFFAPDGEWIGFFVGTQVRKAPVAEGNHSVVCELPEQRRQPSGVWLEDNTIVLAVPRVDSGAGLEGLYRCLASGGGPTRVGIDIDPVALSSIPGRRHILVQTGTMASGEVHLVDLDASRSSRLIDGAKPQFMPPDLLLFTRAEAVWAVRVDLDTAAVVGDAVPVLTDNLAGRNPVIDVSPDGTIAFIAGDDGAQSLVWVTREGVTTPFSLTSNGAIAHVMLSPDGGTLAVGRVTREGEDEHVWLVDLARQTQVRLTTQTRSRRPVWRPDGQRVTFMGLDAAPGIFEATLGDPSAPQRLLERSRSGGGTLFPEMWSPDGRALAVTRIPDPRDILLLTDGKLEPLVDGPAHERSAAFSPDGRRLLFVSDETGRDEVYVQPYPGRGRKTVVSTAGGREAVWAPNGREIFYREGLRMMAVPFDPSTGRLGSPQRLFDLGADYHSDFYRPSYVVTPDGRFIMIRNNTANPDRVRVIVNFDTEIRRRLTSASGR